MNKPGGHYVKLSNPEAERKVMYVECKNSVLEKQMTIWWSLGAELGGKGDVGQRIFS